MYTLYIQMNAVLLFIANFLLQYVGMSLLMIDSYTNLTFSGSKFYLSLFMASAMMLLHGSLATHGTHTRTAATRSWFWLALCGLSAWAYRAQWFITEREFVKEMIEHHAMALFTTKHQIQTALDPAVKALAYQIHLTQQEEVAQMKQWLQQN